MKLMVNFTLYFAIEKAWKNLKSKNKSLLTRYKVQYNQKFFMYKTNVVFNNHEKTNLFG